MPAPLSTNNLGFVIRPAAERFHSSHDWLDSWHSFSFAGHHHPDWMGFGPLRVINDDLIAAGRGFGMHPHRDMEIITVMIEGQINHRDSMGNSGVIRAGEVQRMSAGTGIVHSEINEGDTPCRLLQIWIEPTSAGLQPAYEQRQIPAGNGWSQVLNPDASEGAMAIARPVRLWRGQIEAGAMLPWPRQLSGSAWLQIIDGQLLLDAAHASAPDALGRGDGLGFPGDTPPGAALKAITKSDALLFELLH
jgi:redox-sensitive bicupin YhaK (pirin superfamily)